MLTCKVCGTEKAKGIKKKIPGCELKLELLPKAGQICSKCLEEAAVEVSACVKAWQAKKAAS